MEAIKISVTGAQAAVENAPVITCGMVGVPVELTFDGAWEGLKKTLVYKAGGIVRDQVGVENAGTVPGDVLLTPYRSLQIGVYGASEDGTVVIPTVWTTVGQVREGANPSGDPGTQLALPVWQQLLNRITALETAPGSTLRSSGAPTTATEGTVGQLYMDTDTGDLYKCTAAVDGVYTWEKVGEGTVKTVNGISPDANTGEVIIPTGITKTLLWENASVGSSFVAQIVDVAGIGKFKEIEVEFGSNIQTINSLGDIRVRAAVSVDRAIVNNLFPLGMAFSVLGSTIFTRCFRRVKDGSSVEFLDGKQTTTATNNNALVPYKIYGIKGVQ